MLRIWTVDRLAAIALAAAGAGAFAAALRPAGVEPGWAIALAAAVAGTLLLTFGRRGPDRPMYGDVAARIASPRRRTAVRAAVVATAPLAGAGVVAYAAAALYLVLTAPPTERRQLEWTTCAGTGLLGLAWILAAVTADVTVGSEGLLWSALLVSSGLALFWGASGARGQQDVFEDGPIRTFVGLVLAVAGGAVILDRTGGLGVDERTAVGAVAVVAVCALVIGPRWRRSIRLLEAERRSRAREQERAEIAEMLHDSVLQTLALIQRRAGDSDEVAGLARRQERELREWLLRGTRGRSGATSLDGALRAVVAEVEDDHGVAVEAVVVGDAALSPAVDALVAAAREALVNAARHGAGAQISLFAKVEPGLVAVYVRDRGPGFDPEAVDPERRGLRDSILRRMERIGGAATVVSAPGAGCEVTLLLRRDA